MKRWMTKVRRLAPPAATVLLAGLLLCGCGRGVTDPHGIERLFVPPIVRQMPLATLLAAPESISVDGRSLDVEAHVWWNLAPTVGPHRRRGMIAVIRMRAPDQADFYSGVAAKYLWVVRDEQVWRTVLFVEQPNHYPANEVDWVARNGPSYDGVLSATVVVGILVPDGSLRLVRIPGVTIQTPM